MEISAEQAYLFRHAVLRDAAYHLQPPSERAALHALALGVISALPDINEGAFGLELAQHASLAQQDGPDDAHFAQLERKYLMLGGDHARYNYDYPNALTALQRLHELHADAPGERAKVADLLADLLERLGRWEESLTYFEEVRAHAADPELRGRALVHLVWVGIDIGREVDAPIHEGERIAEQTDSDRLRIAFMMCRAKRHATGGRHDLALGVMGEVIDFARRTDDWMQEMVGHSNAADYAAQAGDLDTARKHNDAAEGLARNPRTRHFLIGVLLNRAMLATRERDYGNALKYADEAARMGVETHSHGLTASALVQRALALTGQGEYAAAFDSLEDARPAIAETGDSALEVRRLVTRAELLRLWGKPELALAELDPGLTALTGRTPVSALEGVRLEIALCRAAQGEVGHALELLDALDGPLARVHRAGLLLAEGDKARAEEILRRWLDAPAAAGLYAEPLEFCARAWLALATGSGDAAREAIEVAQGMNLARHPSPPLLALIDRCERLAGDSPHSFTLH